MAAERAKTVAEAVATESVSGKIGSVSAARKPRVHSAGQMAATHMSAAEAAGSAKPRGVASAALRAKGHSEENCERRDGNQRAHTRSL